MTTVQRWEKREGMPVQRHLHDKIGSATPPARTWMPGRAPESSSRSGAWEHCHLGSSPRPPPERITLSSAMDSRLTAGGGSNCTSGWHNPFASEDGYFLAKPHRGRTISDGHGFRWIRASRCNFPRRPFRSLSVGRDGATDIWVTQVGSGVFHNLTHGSVPDLVNPSDWEPGFSPDGSLLRFGCAEQDASAVATLGV